MQRWSSILFTLTIFFNVLLVFFLLFENKLVIPVWLQVGGRMHPLLLHFPIVLLIVYIFSSLILPRHQQKERTLLRHLLLLAAFTSALTALAGLFLSNEKGYDSTALQWHKWSGTIVSLLACVWYYSSAWLEQKKIISWLIALVALVAIIITGHEGAGITHGNDFLLAPLSTSTKRETVSLEQATVYTHLVQPILEEKCMSCHNTKKAKGELILETPADLLRGGKQGILWDTVTADGGLLLRRLHLPEEDEEHMPPAGKTQLTATEIAILTHWIKKGSSFELAVAQLPLDDTLYQLASKVLSPTTNDYTFSKADVTTLQRLNTENRVVTEEALHSPALTVSFYNSQLFETSQLTDLLAVKKQIVSLNLARMPITDEDIKILAQFENLRQLNLGFTNITGKTINLLQPLQYLHTLSLSGTTLDTTAMSQLNNLSSLRSLQLWNTGINTALLEAWQKNKPLVRLETGYQGDTTILQLSPPVLLNEEDILITKTALRLKHYIQGATIRYTTDGSEPDSLHSPVYKEGISIEGNTLVKAKAYKTGWFSSPVMTKRFYQAIHTPDSIFFLTPPDKSYSGTPAILVNKQLGTTNFRDGSWLAWRQTNMETVLYFDKPTTVNNVTLSMLIDINSYLMPPQTVQVWGGDDINTLKRLSSIIPQQPTKDTPTYQDGIECKFSPTTVRYLKIIATPVQRLPQWHQGKGDKGWFFVDEVFVN